MFIANKKKQVKKLILTGFIILLPILIYTVLKSWDLLIHSFINTSVFSEEDWSDHFAPFKPLKKGYSVLIDLDSLTLHLYKNSKEFKSWPVSGGSKENPSPTGSWVVNEIGNWGKGFGGSWISLNVPWGKYGIHGTVEPWFVGNNNVSHGCIRMKNDDVSELKQYMSAGVPVYIRHDNGPFRTIKDGKVGSDVLELQMMLKQLGYFDGIPDGKFGTGTFKAVCWFQEEEELTVDGEIDQQNWNLLKKRVANAALCAAIAAITP